MNFNWPINPTTVTSGPVQYVHDGVDTEVTRDTVTPGDSRPLPTLALDSSGAEVDFATEAKQDSIITELQQIEADVETANTHLASIAGEDFATQTTLAALNTKVPSNLTVTSTRLLVDGSGVTQPVSASSLPLPTGASTEATLSSLNTKVPSNLTVTSTRLLVDGSGVTQPVSGTVTANAGTGTFAVSASSLPLPTGAATETTLAAASAKLPASLGSKTSATSLSITLSSDHANVPVSVQGTPSVSISGVADVLVSGKQLMDSARRDYSSGNVTTGAWTQLVASLGGDATEIEIFDSSGSTMELGVGAAASEQRVCYIFPGGNGRVPLAVSSGERVSVRAVSANATSGEIIINFYG